MLGDACGRVKHADAGRCRLRRRPSRPRCSVRRHAPDGEHGKSAWRAADRRQLAKTRRQHGRVSSRSRRPCRKSGNRVASLSAAATASATECTDRPIRNAGRCHARHASCAGNESARRCTPCAPAASATSNRSLTSTRVRVPRTASTHAATRRVNGPPSRSRSRTCTRCTPARAAARTRRTSASPRRSRTGGDR